MSIRVTAVLAALLAALTITTTSASADALFTNASPIPINATPTWSGIEVSGQSGRVTKVEVSLRKFIHGYASDVDILLVSPDGKTSLVMSDSCGAIPGWSWTFKQDAAGRMGVGGDQCGEIFYQPSDAASQADTFPGAPAGPVSGLHRSNLDGFLGATPNGTWRLYVSDDVPGMYDGSIDLGWALRIETAEADAVIPDRTTSALADPYPLTRTVSGMSGVIEDVDVSLPGVYHQRAVDLDMLLVGPRGERVMLMSDVCGGFAIRNYAWTFDDEAPDAMAPGSCVDGGRYKPTDNQPGEALPAPAPQDLSDPALSAFDFTDPNGEWRLYVNDDYAAEWGGFLAQRFDLTIKTRPAADVSFAQGTLEVPEGEKRQITLTRPAAGRTLGRGVVTLTSTAQSATAGEDFKPVSTPVEFAPGQTTRTISAEALADTAVEPAEAFTLTIAQPTGDAAIGTTPTATVTIPSQEPAPQTTTDPGTQPVTVSGVDPTTVTLQPLDRQAPVIGPIAVVRGRSARTVRFALSEPAAVTVKLQRARRGRFVTVRTLRRAGVAGANRVALQARRRGSYRLLVAAVDTAGNRAAAPPKRFRITSPTQKDPK